MAENKRKNKKRRIWIISILAVVALAGAAILYFTLIQKQAEPSSAANPGYKTTTVRVGAVAVPRRKSPTLTATALGQQRNGKSRSPRATVAACDVAGIASAATR